ncbi:hypothetical protein Pan216_21200 [Planctomycetes bacterium Pan216]|uniref:Uncharacterized protein n=1 Tax=Kolteria novifilia TaxID=2527975 RepID=A0A518B2V4_9BACT|nr:hypothetical protein Pan216_21200 [Planctomycetes bacterium Pan216]
MSQEIQQAGNFRGDIVSYWLKEAESEAVAIGIEVKILDVWHEGEWCDWSEHNLVARGDLWVIKKDGSINRQQVESLAKSTGFEGNLEAIINQEWDPHPVSIVVQEDSYKDQIRFRISWINNYDATPGGGNISPEKAKQLQQKFGGEFRAIAGNQTRNEAKPKGRPKAAKAKSKGKAKATPAEAEEPVESPVPDVGEDDDAVPF